MESFEVDGVRVSSTTIREALAAGDFKRAKRFLGRPFAMQGRVIRGRQLGRKLGYPTANMRLATAPSPIQGVFAVRTRWQGRDWHDAVASLGTRPAVGGEEFLAVLADTGSEGAMIFAERVRAVLKGHGLGDPPLTVSAGVAHALSSSPPMATASPMDPLRNSFLMCL